MSKVQISFTEEAPDSNIQVDDHATSGDPQGVGFDQLGGFEFVTDSLLFSDFETDVDINIEGWSLELENEEGFLLLESGAKIQLEAQA
jgi:hypothetical protein